MIPFQCCERVVYYHFDFFLLPNCCMCKDDLTHFVSECVHTSSRKTAVAASYT